MTDGATLQPIATEDTLLVETTFPYMGIDDNVEPAIENAPPLSAEDRALLDELGLTLEELARFLDENSICPPVPEPAVPSVYIDCWHPYIMIGHSELPRKSWVISLPRSKYPTLAAAKAVFEEKRERLELRVHGEPFWDFRNWCWRVWR